MQNGQTTADVTCALHQFERNRYFYGKLLTVRDFETEQRYGRGHRYLHNQALHGWGVVCGLTVEPKGGPGNEQKLVVHPGVALDCCGHEMVLARGQEIDLNNFQMAIGPVEATGKTVYLCVKYAECTREPVPALANVSTCEEVCDYNRIQEHVAFEVLTELPAPEASDACETWMNLTTVRSEIEAGEVVIGAFERIAPRWVRPGDVFEVRRRITPFASGSSIQLVDTLPTGFSMLDGALEVEATNTIEGKVAHSAYLVKVDTAVALGTYQITGQLPQSPPTDLPSSDIEVIASTQDLEQHIQEELFTQEFAECPRRAEDANSHCVVLASIALQQQGASFVVGSIDDITLDAARGIYRQLVYPMPLVVELLECLKNDPRLSNARVPLPHAETHQEGGSDEINVTDLSGVLAEAQKIAVQEEGNVVGTRAQLNFTGPGVSASDDASNDRVNITITGGSAVTGRVIFPDVAPGESRQSPLLPHGFDANDVVIVMAVEIEQVFGPTATESVFLGDLPTSTFPALIAGYTRNDPNRQFVLLLRDNRPEGNRVTWRVRWYALPATEGQPTVTVPPGGRGIFPRQFLLAQLAVSPMTVDELARNLGVRPDELQSELDRLREEGHVLEEQGRLFLVSALAERITTFVRNNRGVSITGLAEGLGIGRPALEPVVRRLVEAGVMQRDSRGRLTLVES
jgi:hypothetical protein